MPTQRPQNAEKQRKKRPAFSESSGFVPPRPVKFKRP